MKYSASAVQAVELRASVEDQPELKAWSTMRETSTFEAYFVLRTPRVPEFHTQQVVGCKVVRLFSLFL